MLPALLIVDGAVDGVVDGVDVLSHVGAVALLDMRFVHEIVSRSGVLRAGFSGFDGFALQLTSHLLAWEKLTRLLAI